MKTGLVSISFRKLTPEEIVPLAVRCGLECIEWGSDVHVPVGDSERARQVGELTRQAGLEVSCYGSYYRLTDAEGAPDDVVATAKALGAPLIRVWAGILGSAAATEADRAMVVRNARRIADLAAADGITEAVAENIYRYFHADRTERAEETADPAAPAPEKQPEED